MSLHSPDWTLVMTVINVASFVAIALVARWAGKSLTAKGLSRMRVRKRMALAFGFPDTTGISSPSTRGEIGQMRLRIALSLLAVLSCLLGQLWIAKKTNEATAKWLSDLKSHHGQIAPHRR